MTEHGYTLCSQLIVILWLFIELTIDLYATQIYPVLNDLVQSMNKVRHPCLVLHPLVRGGCFAVPEGL